MLLAPAFRGNTSKIATANCFNRQRYQSYGKKLLTYIEIPAFSVDNVWRGASEIVTRFSFDIGFATLLNKFPIVATGNFCPVVSWRVGESFVRYKLWHDVHEILWLPNYAKQKIDADVFYIEIWNVNPRAVLADEEGNPILTEDGHYIGIDGPIDITTELENAIRIYTSRMVVPDCCCDDDDIALAAGSICVDPIFELADFVPLNGDYYVFNTPCARELIKGRISTEFERILLQSTDGTWHYVYVQEVDDETGTFLDFYIDPTNEAPGTKGYYPLRALNGLTYKIDLQLFDDGSGPVHYMRINDPIVDDDYVNVLRMQSIPDATTRAIRIIADEEEELFLNIQ
jgi:hypothetical protein